MSEFFLGCDVSKGYGDFVLLDKKRKVVESGFQLDDTTEGHQMLCTFLKSFYKLHEDATIYVGLESTGGYESNWLGLFKRLSEAYSLKVTRVDPLSVKKYREAIKKRIVTDAVSAYVIAHYLGAFYQELNFEQDIEFSAMRRQWNLIELLKKQKTQLSNQIGFLIYQSHPELVSYCKDGIPDWVLLLVQKYPTAAELARAKVKSFVKIPFVTLERATTLIAKAKNGVAACTSKTDALIIKTAVEQLISIDNAIEEQKKSMIATYQFSEIKLLTSIPGIGEYSAIGLMAFIISICRFTNVKKLVAFFGMHPEFKESGDGKTIPRLSKHGHSQPRAILYMAVLSGLSCNSVIKELYDRCIKNGMVSQAAIGVCMHKLLRIIYGMLVSGKMFDAMVDEMNKKRKISSKPKQKVEQKRRFQPIDPTAPISGRQYKVRQEKRKGVIEPQMNSVHKNGVIDSPNDSKNRIPSAHKTTSTGCGLVHINNILKSILQEV